MQFFFSYHMITLSSSPLGILTSLDQIFYPLAINTFALAGDDDEEEDDKYLIMSTTFFVFLVTRPAMMKMGLKGSA